MLEIVQEESTKRPIDLIKNYILTQLKDIPTWTPIGKVSIEARIDELQCALTFVEFDPHITNVKKYIEFQYKDIKTWDDSSEVSKEARIDELQSLETYVDYLIADGSGETK